MKLFYTILLYWLIGAFIYFGIGTLIHLCLCFLNWIFEKKMTKKQVESLRKRNEHRLKCGLGKINKLNHK